jgi:hypothetical protein
MSTQVPLYRFTVRMNDGTPDRTCDAIAIFREADPWLIFDDTHSTVLTLRSEKVDEIARSSEPVGHQLVDELDDPEPRN